MKLKKLLSIIYLTFICSFLTFADVGEGISDVGTLNSYPYILKRVVNNSFDYFRMDKNNWQYTNQGAIMWPQSWWQQFDYTQPPYPWAWRFKPSSSFPDWPLFVDTFGEDYCYLNQPPGLIIYSPPAALQWLFNSKPWRGSCTGLAAGSILAFRSENAFKQRFPELGSFDCLYSVLMNDDVRKVINLLWTIQKNEQSQNHMDDNINNTPNETLNELKNVLSYPNNNDHVLLLFNQYGSGAHAILPYLIREGTTIDTVEVYDNISTIPRRVLINKQNNSWEYSINGKQWGGDKGLFLSESLTGYLYVIPPPKKNQGKNTIVSIYSEMDDDILIINLNQPNEYIHYNPIDTTITNTFAFGRPIIPFTGGVYPPIGYRLYDGDYKMEISSKTDTSTNVLVMREHLFYNYSRKDCEDNETDMVKIQGDSLKLSNNDAVNKNIDCQIILEENNDFKTYSISNTLLMQNDSLSAVIDTNQDFILVNKGAAKTYDLKIVFQNTEREDLFLHQQISITLSTIHKIVPDWDSLITSLVKILIDSDGDGIFEDSVFINNQVTSINQDRFQIPTDFRLNQNYPNPFNPTTTISYSIPEVSNVTLKVYDVLGNEIATLVTEEKAPGNYSVQFDSKNLSSGIYFYVLQAGTYTATRKMILLK